MRGVFALTLLGLALIVVGIGASRGLRESKSIGLQTFSGYAYTNLELNIFVPCDTDEVAPLSFSDAYWLETADPGSAYPVSGFWEQYDRLLFSAGGTHAQGFSVYVRFLGQRSPPVGFATQTGYGYLGMYRKQIKVLEVLEMEPVNNQCEN